MSRFNPHYPDAAQVFEAADRFKQRCLLGQESLLLDGCPLWTTEHFQALIDNYVKQPDVGEGKFYEKLKGQLAACSALDVALMAELFWIVQLAPANLRPQTKLATVQRIWDMNPAAPFPKESPFLAPAVLGGLGSAGPGYNQYLWMEMVFAVDAFADLVAKPLAERQTLLSDDFAFRDWLDSIPSGKGRQLYHTLCHVFFPDDFERIFSQGNKLAVARKHRVWTHGMGDNRPLMDAVLFDLRKRLEAEYGQPVDYYAKPLGTLMKQEEAAPAASVQEPRSAYEAESVVDVEVPWRLADNLILCGPPGTGKTFEMQRMIQAAFERGEEWEFVTFHPNYAYEDFIGGLRPTAASNGAGVVFPYQKGPFLRLCDKAHAEPEQQFTLFIDEINRANVAKVFGELITLIEPSKRVRAGSRFREDTWVSLPGLEAPLGVPDNLNIVATMNTADRSIAMMDIALRRRFRFKTFPPQPERIVPERVGMIDLPSLLKRLNERLEFLLDSHYLIGHAYFMGIESLAQLQAVLANRIIPLLEEYFFDDLEKVRLVLTGSEKESVFFTSRTLSPSELFPGARQAVGTDARVTFSVGDPGAWTEEDIRRLYTSAPSAPVVPVNPITDASALET